MLYVKKDPNSEVFTEIRRVKNEMEWRSVNKNDTQAVRTIFDQLDKDLVRMSLYREQKGLCAYCMRRIKPDHQSVIEHFIPVEKEGEKALDYQNLLLCCDGGRTSDDKNKVLCCDASKQNRTITINPLKREQMEKIRYKNDGRIYTYPKDDELDYDINEVLHLNGMLDKEGNIVSDTSTSIVFGRKQASKICIKMIQKLEKRNKCTKQELTKICDRIADRNPYDEYAGVYLYVLRKKIKAIS
jgi:uncharacterized protein (TIGR02646 family)